MWRCYKVMIQGISLKLLLAYFSYYIYRGLPSSHHFRKENQSFDLTDVLFRRHQIRTRRIKYWRSNTSKEHPPRDCKFVTWYAMCSHVVPILHLSSLLFYLNLTKIWHPVAYSVSIYGSLLLGILFIYARHKLFLICSFAHPEEIRWSWVYWVKDFIKISACTKF